MNTAHRRKKDPAHVRAQLVANAITLASEKGLDAVGIEAVAKAAGVTKGGFFHHFSTKQDLVDAVFEHLLADMDRALEKLIAADPVRRGRFTRAYLGMTLDTELDDVGVLALWASSITMPRLRDVWRNWITGHLARHGDDEAGVDLAIVRIAADGLWLNHIMGVVPTDLDGLTLRLIELTKTNESPQA